MVLNPNGIEPTFLKLDSWSPGAGFIPIITSNVLNKIPKEKKIQEKKSVLCIQKNIMQFLKMGSIPFWVQFHGYPYSGYQKVSPSVSSRHSQCFIEICCANIEIRSIPNYI